MPMSKSARKRLRQQRAKRRKKLPVDTAHARMVSAWKQFLDLAEQIRGNSNMLRTVGVNSAMDVPHFWLQQGKELHGKLVVAADAVEDYCAAVDESDNAGAQRERDAILVKMKVEFDDLTRVLIGDVKYVESLLNDPLRTSTSSPEELALPLLAD